MRLLRSFLVIVLFFLISSSFAQSQIIYGAATGLDTGNAPSSLYMIDPNTGASTLIGPIGFNGVTGIEILPDGRLIASANADDEEDNIAVLIEIDKNTGAGTLIGVLGSTGNMNECGRMPDIAYDSNTGQLFGYSDFCAENDLDGVESNAIFGFEGLYIIDPDTADVTFVGPSGFTGGGNGLAVRPSDGTIFNTAFDQNSLVILNRSTGMGTSVPGSEGEVPGNIGALDFNSNGVLYGALKPQNSRGSVSAALELNNIEEESTLLVRINTNNGRTTLVNPTVLGLDAIVFDGEAISPVPTLSEYALIATALLLLAGSVLVLRRRQKLSV